MGIFNIDTPQYDTTPTPAPPVDPATRPASETTLRKQAKNPAMAPSSSTTTTADGTAISITVPTLATGKPGLFRVEIAASPVHPVPGVASLPSDRLPQLQGITLVPDDALIRRIATGDDVTITPKWIAPSPDAPAIEAGKLESILTVRFVPANDAL